MFSRHRATFARHWREIASGFLKLGATAYGGPAIMGIMQAEFQEKERALGESRERLRELERASQEAVFAEKTQRSRIDELRRTIATAQQQAAQVLDSIGAGKLELEALESGAAAEGLQELLSRRTEQEQALSDARHELDQLTQQLRQC